MKTKITVYSDSYVNDLRDRFIIRFNIDPRPRLEKLKTIDMHNSTFYSVQGNGKVIKRTIERMRAYLENRPPKFCMIKSGEAYCGSCEEIVLLTKMRDQWTCNECKNERFKKTRAKNRKSYLANRRKQYAIAKLDPEFMRRKREYEFKRKRKNKNE